MMIEKKIKCHIYDEASESINKVEMFDSNGNVIDSSNIEMYLEIDYNGVMLQDKSKYYICNSENMEELCEYKPGKLK